MGDDDVVVKAVSSLAAAALRREVATLDCWLELRQCLSKNQYLYATCLSTRALIEICQKFATRRQQGVDGWIFVFATNVLVGQGKARQGKWTVGNHSKISDVVARATPRWAFSGIQEPPLYDLATSSTRLAVFLTIFFCLDLDRLIHSFFTSFLFQQTSNQELVSIKCDLKKETDLYDLLSPCVMHCPIPGRRG